MFLNVSNHPSSKWDKEQLEAAEKWGKIEDIAFPVVPPEAEEEEIEAMAEKLSAQILSYSPDAVMCQGEFTLCFSIVNKLKLQEIPVMAACSGRFVEEHEDEDGNCVKKVLFRFERFREYK